jgi:hypothetical protein
MRRLQQDNFWSSLESPCSITLLGMPGCIPCEVVMAKLEEKLPSLNACGWRLSYIYVGHRLIQALQASGLAETYPTTIVRWLDGRLERHVGTHDIESAMPKLLEARFQRLDEVRPSTPPFVTPT